MNELIFSYIKNITDNYVVLFLLVFLASEWCFLYFYKIIIIKPYFRWEEQISFSTLNGFLIIIFTIYVGERAPVFMLIASPSLIILELMIMSRDSLFSYAYHWVKILCNFICFYWLTVSVLGLISPRLVSAKIVLPITIFISGWWCLFLSENKRYPIKELKVMIHNQKMGLMHFSFLVVCTASLLFSTWVLRPIILEDIVNMGKIQKIFFIEMFLKTSLVFSSGYLLLFIRARELNQRENIRLLTLNLEKEERFRRSTWQDSFLSFYVNITKNQIQEGRDLFTPFMWDGVNNYAEMLQKMSFYCVHPEDRKDFAFYNKISVIEERMKRKENSIKHEMRISPKEMLQLFHLPPDIKEKYRKLEDEWVWIKVKYVYTKSSKDEDINIYVSITDIHEMKTKEQNLKRAATIDKLTGLSNRATLEQMIENRIIYGIKEQKKAGTMILLDVDYFKSVNDLLGHPAGDKALQTVAERLKEIFRSEDIVGRLGGDEFCVFLNSVTDINLIKKRLKTINEKCRKDYEVKGKEPIHLSVSIGAVVCTPEIKSYDELYKLADRALYQTKERGKNSYTIL